MNLSEAYRMMRASSHQGSPEAADCLATMLQSDWKILSTYFHDHHIDTNITLADLCDTHMMHTINIMMHASPSLPSSLSSLASSSSSMCAWNDSKRDMIMDVMILQSYRLQTIMDMIGHEIIELRHYSAMVDYAIASYNLGLFYWNGALSHLGYARDLTRAFQLMKRAHELGDVDGLTMANRIKAQMDIAHRNNYAAAPITATPATDAVDAANISDAVDDVNEAAVP